MTAPDLIVFDVNETLSDLSGLRARFEEVGAPAHLTPTWFAQVLRDGFALTAVGEQASFSEIASTLLDQALRDIESDERRAEAVRHVLDGFSSLDLHADVAPGVAVLRDRGIRLVTLSNGSASVAESLLARAELRDAFEAVLSVDDAGLWKPAALAYRHALAATGVSATAAMLVAVHPWDIDGARRAGLRTAWLNRDGATYPAYFAAPEIEASSLLDLAAQLG